MSVDFRSLQERLRQRLRAEIEMGELTGIELARVTGFRQAHISNFLNRKRGLSLEAMDEILKARKLSLPELMSSRKARPATARSIQAATADCTYIPLVDEKSCHASEVPYSATKHTLQVMSDRLEKQATRMSPARAHWQRFVAVRVTARDAEAMAPRLAKNAVAVIDRHCHQVDGGASMYLVRYAKNAIVRYVERAAEELILRPESARHPLIRLRVEGSMIVGRVCLVIAEV